MSILSLSTCRKIAAALVVISWTGLANSQTTQLPTAQEMCEGAQIGFRVISLQRTAPGTLVLTVEYENKANLNYMLASSRIQGWAQLTDDQGETWPYKSTDLEGKTLAANMKFRAKHQFFRKTGGSEAVSASIVNKVQIVKSFDSCSWTAKNIPISG